MGELSIAEKSKSITTDNAPNIVAAITELKTNDGLQDMTHIRCGTHIINLIVEAGIKELGGSFDKIRFYCNKVYNTILIPFLIKKFKTSSYKSCIVDQRIVNLWQMKHSETKNQILFLVWT